LVRERELSNRGCHKAVPLPARPGFVSAIPVIKPFCWPKKGVHPCISNFIILFSSIIPWQREKRERKDECILASLILLLVVGRIKMFVSVKGGMAGLPD
jgi:hypothetical protein